MASNRPYAVILGLSPTGLYAVRELGRAGIPVVGMSQQSQCGNASRYLETSAICATQEEMLSFLLGQCTRLAHKPVLIPTSDQDIEFVTRHAAKLAKHFVFQRSYSNGLAQSIMTKASFYDLCANHDVEIPLWYEIARDDLKSIRSSIAYPCFVKPSRIHEIKHTMAGSSKGWVSRNVDEFDRLGERIPPGNHDLIVQEIIPGPESNITLYCAYFDNESTPHQAFTGRKLRQYPPGFGSASLVASEVLEETQKLSERTLKSIGYQGIAATEFKKDPRDGRLKLIEINPRPSLWFSASSAAGRQITLAAYHDLAGTCMKVPDIAQNSGVLWRYGLKDLYASLFYKFRQNFVLPAPDVSAVKSATTFIDAVHCSDDPAPTWAERRNLARKLTGRLLASPQKPKAKKSDKASS